MSKISTKYGDPLLGRYLKYIENVKKNIHTKNVTALPVTRERSWGYMNVILVSLQGNHIAIFCKQSALKNLTWKYLF